jgi:2-methylcitrate dehydratase PrpD
MNASTAWILPSDQPSGVGELARFGNQGTAFAGAAILSGIVQAALEFLDIWRAAQHRHVSEITHDVMQPADRHATPATPEYSRQQTLRQAA